MRNHTRLSIDLGFLKPVPFFPRALDSRPIVLAFLYVFDKLSLDVNTIGF